MDVLLLAFQMVVGIVVPAYIVRWDIRRLSGVELSRAWPAPSVWVAVALVSPFAVLLHFVRTRRTPLGIALGVGWFAVCALVLFGTATLLELVLPRG